MIDEYTREGLAMEVARSITASDVIFCLADLFIKHGLSIVFAQTTGRSSLRNQLGISWLDWGPGPLYIEPGSPWENGYIESYNGNYWMSC